MAKQLYKDVKHPDKFHEALSGVWAKMEPYALHAGLGVLVVIVVAGVWFAVWHQSASRRDAAWAKDFAIERQAREAAAEAETAAEREKVDEQTAAELEAFVREYQRRPVAAVALLKLAQAHARLGRRARGSDRKAAREHFRESAEAAEQFLADFPDHGLTTLAAWNAGKARFELREYPRAAQHFQQATGSQVRFLAALARWHAGRCYEHMGRAEAAREAYEALRNERPGYAALRAAFGDFRARQLLAVNPALEWCAQQAQWRLAQLQRKSPKGS